ncbi:hypothetical protein Bbelb_293490 [Branchiostoma belcheri]|nr:hypothetical protein Bbelb_293490 [Branchiostoma belcheri]
MYRKPPGFVRTRSRVQPFPDKRENYVFLSWFLTFAVFVVVTIVLTISLRPLFIEESAVKKERLNAEEKTRKTGCQDTGVMAKGKTGQPWRKSQNKRRGNRGGDACEGVIIIDYLQKGQTINGVYCAPELRQLRATITEKRGEKLRVDVLTMHLSTQHRAPWAFYLFPKLEFHLRGQRFDGDDGVIDVQRPRAVSNAPYASGFCFTRTPTVDDTGVLFTEREPGPRLASYMYRTKGRPVPQKPSIRSPAMIYQRKSSDLLPRTSRAKVKEYPDQKCSVLPWLVFLATLLVIVVALMISLRPSLIDEPRTNLHRAKGKVGDDADFVSVETEGEEEVVENDKPKDDTAQQTIPHTARQTVPAPVKDNLPSDDEGPKRDKYVNPEDQPVLSMQVPPKGTERLGGMMNYHQVIPDALDQSPTSLLQVWFRDTKIEVGSEVDPQVLQAMPRLWWETTEGQHYTLVMTADKAGFQVIGAETFVSLVTLTLASYRSGPPFPCQPHLPRVLQPDHREHRGQTREEQVSLETGDVIAEYLPPAPAKNTGVHRYLIAVFQQSHRIEFDEPRMAKTDKKRARFKTKDFAAKYGFPAPVAGTVFLSQYNGGNKAKP